MCMEIMKFLTIIGIALLSDCACTATENLRVEIDEDLGTFKIFLSDQMWFNSGGVWARNNGRWYTTETLWGHDKLRLFGQHTTTGKLDWGPMNIYNFNYMSDDKFAFTTYIVVFEEVPAVIFGQQWDSGGTDSSTGSTNDTISMWPTFKIEDELGLERGFLTYGDNHVRKIVVGSFNSSMESIYKTMDGGLPVAIFDSKMENTVVISPQNTFMSSHQQVFTPSGSSTPIFGTGILGSVDMVPEGYFMETLLVAGNNVTSTMEQWGRLLRLQYKKHDHYRLNDFFINYLGYYTDNGACYYYSHGDFIDYNAALLAVKQDAVQENIPYRYLQLDSWWYYKGLGGGVKNWTAMDSVFPFGIDYIAKSTDWPLAAHNRYFSPDTDYASQNGGQYYFVVNETANISLPDDVNFWKDLFRNCSNGWNLHVYEQDWLDSVYERLPAVQRELGLGENWVAKMAYAAEEIGITIQYSMVWPRFVMQSVAFPVVTHARASDDYLVTPNNWMIADSTIFFHALGLAAFKDTFHTVTNESFCHFNHSEFSPVLETYIAALSGGPVAPSDTVGTANLMLIMATCMADGLLLKPTRPGMSLDSTFVQRAFGRGGPVGVAQAAYTEISDLTWYYILAVLNETYRMPLTDLPPSSSLKPRTYFPQSVAVQYDLSGKISKLVKIPGGSTSLRLTLSRGSKRNFKYWLIAPVLPKVQMALLGDLSKVVSMSEQRVLSIINIGANYIMQLRGAPGEIVTMTMIGYNTGKMVTFSAIIGQDGAGSISIYSPSY